MSVPQQYEPSGRRRGSALIVVLIFVVAVVGILSFLLPYSTKSVQAQGENAQARSLNLVLSTGIAEALNELREAADSSLADGKGAVLDAGNTGIQITDPTTGRNLGWVRATVETVDAGKDLTLKVVAAYPSFSHPNRLMVAARVHVVKPPGDITALFGDRQPLIASGPIAGDDPNNLDSEIRFDSNHNDINIVDPTGANAALNVTDEGAKAEWLSDFVGESSVYLEGAGGTGASTAVSQDGTILNNDSLQSISETLYAYASSFNAGNADYNITGDASNGTKIKNADLLNIGGPGQVVIWDQGNNMRVENGRTLSGSGTLIITRRLEVDEGATFIWDGDVIIMGSQNHAKLEIQDGTVTINGNLIAATDPNGNKRADVRMSSNSILNITNTNGDGGSFLMLSRGGEAEFHLDTSGGGSNSPTVNVDGVLALLGDDIDVRLEGKHSDHAVLNISGGLVIAVPEEGDGIKRLRFDHIDMDIIFDETNYDEAINGLGDFFGTIEDPSDPVEITTKWDRSGYVGVAGQALYDEQTADLAAGNYKVD